MNSSFIVSRNSHILNLYGKVYISSALSRAFPLNLSCSYFKLGICTPLGRVLILSLCSVGSIPLIMTSSKFTCNSNEVRRHVVVDHHDWLISPALLFSVCDRSLSLVFPCSCLCLCTVPFILVTAIFLCGCTRLAHFYFRTISSTT